MGDRFKKLNTNVDDYLTGTKTVKKEKAPPKQTGKIEIKSPIGLKSPFDIIEESRNLVKKVPQVGMGDLKTAEQYGPAESVGGKNIPVEQISNPITEKYITPNVPGFLGQFIENLTSVKNAPPKTAVNTQGQKSVHQRKTETLEKVRSGEVRIPELIKAQGDDAILQYLGLEDSGPLNLLTEKAIEIPFALQNLSTVIPVGVSKLINPKTDESKLLPEIDKRAGYKKYTPYEMPKYTTGSEIKDLMLKVGPDIAGIILTQGAVGPGIQKVLSNPKTASILSSGLGFVLPQQPRQLSELSAGNITPGEYGAETGTSFVTGGLFGANPFKGLLKRAMFNSFVTTLPGQYASLMRTGEFDIKEYVKSAVTQGLLDATMHIPGLLKRNTRQNIKEDLINDLTAEAEKLPEKERTVENIITSFDRILEGPKWKAITKENRLLEQGKPHKWEISPKGEITEVKKSKEEPLILTKGKFWNDILREDKPFGYKKGEIKEAPPPGELTPSSTQPGSIEQSKIKPVITPEEQAAREQRSAERQRIFKEQMQTKVIPQLKDWVNRAATPEEFRSRIQRELLNNTDRIGKALVDFGYVRNYATSEEGYKPFMEFYDTYKKLPEQKRPLQQYVDELPEPTAEEIERAKVFIGFKREMNFNMNSVEAGWKMGGGQIRKGLNDIEKGKNYTQEAKLVLDKINQAYKDGIKNNADLRNAVPENFITGEDLLKLTNEKLGKKEAEVRSQKEEVRSERSEVSSEKEIGKEKEKDYIKSETPDDLINTTRSRQPAESREIETGITQSESLSQIKDVKLKSEIQGLRKELQDLEPEHYLLKDREMKEQFDLTDVKEQNNYRTTLEEAIKETEKEVKETKQQKTLYEVQDEYGGKYKDIELPNGKFLKLRIADHSGRLKNDYGADEVLHVIIGKDKTKNQFFSEQPVNKLIFDGTESKSEIIKSINNKINEIKKEAEGKVEKIYYRGIPEGSQETGDLFYSASREVAEEYKFKTGKEGKSTEIKESELPKKLYEAESKEDLAKEIGLETDKVYKIDYEFDRKAKDILQKRGYEGIRYKEGTWFEGGPEEEIHIFKKKLNEVIEKKYAEAKQRVADRKNNYGLQSSIIGGFNPENIPDYVIIGAKHFKDIYKSSAEKVVKFAEWSNKMINDLGEYVKPYLRQIWGEVQKQKEDILKATENTEGKTREDFGFTEKGEIKTEGTEKKAGLPKREKILPEEGDTIKDLERKALELKRRRKSNASIREILGHDFTYTRNDISGEWVGAEYWGEVKKSKKAEAKSEKEIEEEGIPLKDRSNYAELEQQYYDLLKYRRMLSKGNAEYENITESVKKIHEKMIEIEAGMDEKYYEYEPGKQKPERKDLIGTALELIPKLEKIAAEKGYQGEDAKEQVKRLLTKELYTNPDFQQLSSRKKAKILKQLDKFYQERTKQEFKLINTLDEQYTEPKLRNFFKKSVLQSIKVVDKMGEGGKEIAKRLRQMEDHERQLMGEPSKIMLEAEKLTPEEFNNLQDIRNSLMFFEEPINPKTDNVARVNSMLDNYYNKMAEGFKERGFITTNPATGEKYLFNPLQRYEPRILDLKIDKLGITRDTQGKPIYDSKREQILQYLVDTNQADNKAEAEAKLQGYIAMQNTRIGRQGNVEFARVLEFPRAMYVKDPITRLIKYGTRSAKRLAHADAFGIEGNIASRLLDRLRGEYYDQQFARDLYRYETGQLTVSERKALESINVLKGIQAVTKFSPFTTLRNAMQGFLGSTSRGNLKAGITGLIKGFTKDAKKYAYWSGALADTLENYVGREMGGESKFVSNYLKWIGFTGTDKFNRIISSAAGEVFYKDMLKRIQKDSILKRRAGREFDKMGLDTEQITKRGHFTEEELNKIRRTFAGDAQFNIRPSDLPLYWSSPVGKLITQWKSFGYKMTQLINDNIIKETKAGNIFPLLTMLGAYTITGEAVNTIIDAMRSVFNFNPRKEDIDSEGFIDKTAYMKLKKGKYGEFALRIVSDLSGLGAMSIAVDIFRSMGYGKSSAMDTSLGVTGAVFGPTISTGIGITADIVGPIAWKLFSTEGEWDEVFKRSMRGTYRTAIANIPFMSIPRTLGLTKLMESKIFGVEPSQKMKDYQELKKRGYNITKLIEIDAMEKETGKLRKKALETEEPKDAEEYRQADEELDLLKDSSEEYREYIKLRKEKQQENDRILGKKKKYKVY